MYIKINDSGLIWQESMISEKDFIRGRNDSYGTNFDDLFYKADNVCVHLYDIADIKLFDNKENYALKANLMPDWVFTSGIDSSNALSKSDFEQFLNESSNIDINKFLYLRDFHALISSLQDRIVFINGLFIDFYKALGELEPINKDKDGVFAQMGYNTIPSLSYLYNLITSMYCCFDITTKIAFEFENIAADFSSYPKLYSNGKLIGAAKNLKGDYKDSGIFKRDSLFKLIETLRNEVIHNGSLEMNSKIYVRIKDKKCIEKWILIPDTKDGRFDKSNNRKHFFAEENRINETLPDLLRNFMTKLIESLESISKNPI